MAAGGQQGLSLAPAQEGHRPAERVSCGHGYSGGGPGQPSITNHLHIHDHISPMGRLGGEHVPISATRPNGASCSWVKGLEWVGPLLEVSVGRGHSKAVNVCAWEGLSGHQMLESLTEGPPSQLHGPRKVKLPVAFSD